MANQNLNINPIPNSFPETAGKFFAGINARIREAEKNALIEAEKRLPSNVQASIKKHRDLINNNVQTIQANPKQSNILKRQNAITQKRIDKLLSTSGFKNIYDDLQNEKRIVREESRKRRREPEQLPSDADVLEASKEAEAAIAAADELLEEPETELPVPPTVTESVSTPAAEIMPPSPPPKEQATDVNKIANVLVDSLMSAAQSSIKMPPAPTMSAEDVEADMPAPFEVTTKLQPAPVIATDNVPAAAVAETIVNSLEESQNAVELPPLPAPTTISPGALANVIVNALKLASTTPVLAPIAQAPTPIPITQVQEPLIAHAPTPIPITPAQEPLIAQVSAPVPITPAQEPPIAQVPAPVPAPSILPGALANVIVNALKLASTQALATPETVTPTVQPAMPTLQEPATPVPAPLTPTDTGDKCGESPGFIALIQKYLEPIIGQFSPPETKPQKVFDKTQLPEDMQHILDDNNIRYIGRYRTETKSGKNELSKEAHQQTTYLFWDTSNHDYISHTLTDVVHDVLVEVPSPLSTTTTDALVAQLPLPPTTAPVSTTNALVAQLPLPPTTAPVSNEKLALSV